MARLRQTVSCSGVRELLLAVVVLLTAGWVEAADDSALVRSLTILPLDEAAPLVERPDDSARLRAGYGFVRPAVVRIHSAGGVAAGFFVAPDRHLLTAYHVVRFGRPIRVVFDDQSETVATVVAVDRRHDLALLEIERMPDRLVPLPLAPDESVYVGEPVWAVGHPYSSFARLYQWLDGLLDWSLTVGRVSNLGATYLQTDTPLNPGNSGGPLMDLEGRVVGLVSRKRPGSDGLGFATRVVHIRALLAQQKADQPFAGSWRDRMGFGLVRLPRQGGALWGVLGRYDVVARGRWQGSAWIGLGRVGLLGGALPSGDHVSRSLGIGIDLGYRWLVELGERMAFYLAPTGSLSIELDRMRRSDLVWTADDPSCPTPDQPSCSGELQRRSTVLPSVFELQSSVGLSIESWPIRLDYRIEFPLLRSAPERPEYRIGWLSLAMYLDVI